ncbi:MAG: hypothetical protein A2268_13575 [Candidatus Raymondbacteria bacterium RifOxyA12_full_50_37]|uniref:Uncharacterized protein n=1 Tax=Candidatus Raymondbacteria bacterium RIFOXYD12_FULL_49_13 TaxID=1817890 RepID=A0A1F7F8J8_UNCRA|nr:MAG: hypothetical protein A2350_08215 [Candidatus Raymondbacteria bacterium RifOxyB12_full_50_8]OGJ90417.1 MAG: hypothetical protein A2268_13575 [Candidatus Raymondbacteria bacterium RifOxyA12_full_50_37]OGJ91501.1 MAG: hypothetical protein A2248_03620 [Candidatus Raymondbacteria bacterium RIFOXYA2_FULL_49_16]OGJ97815.1 MAG: hypothetical protein A2453_14005 [Candidatus Raymondbacteria bacterium RIFOXYC2_FULL_50_21]OGK02101.1 MAG: hypothetical protein A2487_20855 [Candidatus Raymondbacteria b
MLLSENKNGRIIYDYLVNTVLPAKRVLAETLDYAKGDILDWSVKDHATLLLRKIESAVVIKSPRRPKVRTKA